MDILRANSESTKKYTIKLQETRDKWRLGRINMKEKLVKLAAEQVAQISENTDDDSIGCPTLFCDELTKAKIEYQELVLKETAEVEQVMEDYIQEMVRIMRIDTVGNTTDTLELKIYKDHMNANCVTQWEYLKGNINKVFPNGHSYNSSMNANQWKQNFKAVIDAKLIEEKTKLNNTILVQHGTVVTETKQDGVVKKKKKIIRY